MSDAMEDLAQELRRTRRAEVQARAKEIKADLGNRTVTLDGGARLKIEQGTVR